jgi:hypothetical protein
VGKNPLIFPLFILFFLYPCFLSAYLPTIPELKILWEKEKLPPPFLVLYKSTTSPLELQVGVTPTGFCKRILPSEEKDWICKKEEYIYFPKGKGKRTVSWDDFFFEPNFTSLLNLLSPSFFLIKGMAWKEDEERIWIYGARSREEREKAWVGFLFSPLRTYEVYLPEKKVRILGNYTGGEKLPGEIILFFDETPLYTLHRIRIQREFSFPPWVPP